MTAPAVSGAAPGGMLDVLTGFISELRGAGLPVSLTENLDAMEAIQHIPMEDREAFKYALAATLVKSNAHWRAFETVFDVYFSLRGPQWSVDGEDVEGSAEAQAAAAEAMADARRKGEGKGGGAMDGLSAEELAEILFKAMMRDDQAMTRAVARESVTRYAGMEPGRPVGGTYYLYRTLRNLDLEGLMKRLMEAAKEESDGGLTPLEERLIKDEYELRIDQLRKEV
ncbi:MAG: vWA domain-containing protein, partial [Acidimicrobiales bacterium]